MVQVHFDGSRHYGVTEMELYLLHPTERNSSRLLCIKLRQVRHCSNTYSRAASGNQDIFIPSAKFVVKFHDHMQIEHEVNALFESHLYPQGMQVGFKPYVGLALVCMGWMSHCKSSIHN